MQIPKRKIPASRVATDCRRRTGRSSYDASVALAVMRGDEFGPPINVQAVDISVAGIAVITRQMMHQGTIGALHLSMPEGTTLVVGVEVRNCQYIGEMNHRVGLRFTALHPRHAKCPNLPAKCRVISSRHAHEAFCKSLKK